MADLKPAYLIHGDDEAKLDAWRKRIRARAEREAATPRSSRWTGERDRGEEVAAAIGALTLAIGRRYVLVGRHREMEGQGRRAGRRRAEGACRPTPSWC